MDTWRDLIAEEMAEHGESWADVVAAEAGRTGPEPPPPDWMDEEFDGSFGSPTGRPFTLWTKDRVYAPHEYDGAESVVSLPRDPCEEVTEHLCGERWD